AGPDPDALRDAGPGAGGELDVHRLIRIARRVPRRHGRRLARCGAFRADRRRRRDRRHADLDVGLPAASPRRQARNRAGAAAVTTARRDPGLEDPGSAYKPSLMGASWEFRLRPDALEWHAGGRGGRIPYGTITRVRLSFRPVTMQTRRFVTEIWSPGAARADEPTAGECPA